MIPLGLGGNKRSHLSGAVRLRKLEFTGLAGGERWG